MTQARPKISIITPTLNADNVIATSLLSICNQSYTNIEHLIIDGGSTDDTVTIIKKYQKTFPHIRLITGQDNGVYQAMNKGLECSTGDWFYFLGADDRLFDPDTIGSVVREDLLNREQVVYGNVIISGSAGWAKDNQVYDGPFDLAKLFRKNICHQAIFYPSDARHKVGLFNERYRVTADWDYNFRCWAEYPFVFINKTIAVFHAGGTSSKGTEQEFFDDLPGNIIRYFKLDPSDPKFNYPDNPFYYPVSLYRNLELQRNIQGLEERNRIIEAENRRKEKDILEIRSSITWKTGRFLLAPIRILNDEFFRIFKKIFKS